MITYIKGMLEDIQEDYIVLDHGGIGYEIKVPLSIIPNLPKSGEEIKIFTFLYVREDAMVLYGFLSEDDLRIFKLLLTVNGIGPKGALAILSVLTPDELRMAVITEDDGAITKAPGIGKKTALRLIIDLKDKLKMKEFAGVIGKEMENASVILNMDAKEEAVSALISLGYSNHEAQKAVRGYTGETTVEEVLKYALKQLSRL
jgi:Holliday junction DNA helicase RuvA